MYDTETQKDMPFEKVAHKDVYRELIRTEHQEHHSKKRWDEKFTNTEMIWPQIWKSLNNPIATENTKTIIWEQIHLNDYCTFYYNKAHKTQQKCPLCLQLPLDRFHLTLDCRITSILWKDLEFHLNKIHSKPITDLEKIFGLQGNTPGIILRNWLTFLLRQCIVQHESIAFYNKKGLANEAIIKMSYNQMVKNEVLTKYNIFTHLGRLDYFEQLFAVNKHLLAWNNEQWEILTLYPTNSL